MIIDYSITNSSIIYYARANFDYGLRHIALACTPQIPLAVMGLIERIAHIILGIGECVPGIGHLIALGDYFVNRSVKILHLHNDDPYQNGLLHGRTLRREIQMIYPLVIAKIQERIVMHGRGNFMHAVQELQRRVSNEVLFEMQGIAEGAQVPLEQVFQVHTFLDIYAGMYGCSAVASLAHNTGRARVAVTNHFQAQSMLHYHTNMRMEALLNDPLEESVVSHQRALARVGQEDTLQSVVFDVDAREVHYSFAWHQAPQKTFTRFVSNFPLQQPAPPRRQVKLATNLDWPWKVLAPYTLLLDTVTPGKRRFINVTFPGFIGVLRGMNQDGVSVSCCQAGRSRQDNGVPNTFVFRDILETARSTQEALDRLGQLRPASSMNMIIAAPDGAVTLELDPDREAAGIALISNRVE